MIGDFLVYKKTENNLFSLNLGIRYKNSKKDLGIPTFCCIINEVGTHYSASLLFFYANTNLLTQNRANGPSIVSAKAAVRVDATGVGTCAFGIVRVVCVERTRPIATVRAYAFQRTFIVVASRRKKNRATVNFAC
jgi:hypothetical protein